MGGGSSSPRRITVEEEEVGGVVKVSESVARRLLGQPEPSGRKAISPDSSGGENKEDLQKLESFYRQRIEALEEKNNRLFEETREQFAKAVEEVETKFLKTTSSPICEDLQAAVLKCYQDNPKHTLICSPQVKAFNQCVQAQREKILTKKG